jgi:uncharacterized damage-inducible protein DinB
VDTSSETFLEAVHAIGSRRTILNDEETSMSIAQSLLPEFEHEMATTRRLLERVPEDRPEWQPHSKSMTLNRLASHVAELPGWTGMTLRETELDLLPPGATEYQPRTFAGREEMLAEFDRNVAEAKEVLAATDDAGFMVPWTLKKGGETLFTLPRIAVLRSWMMNHIIHHRGQLSVYLRLNDVPVPAIYGPTADEG